MDCPNVRRLATQYPDARLYGLNNMPDGLNLIVPGQHNVSNALAALAVSDVLGLDQQDSIASLNTFKGITSRLEIIGRTNNNVTVMDDFAHNPDKITSSLKTLKDEGRHIHLIYQPQGFGPLKHQKTELIDIFSKFLGENDVLYMLEAFYAGGTADKSVSSAEIVDELHGKPLKSMFFDNKAAVLSSVLSKVTDGDIICVMGARDDGLREMARQIFKELK